jgi:hypothetical protein
MPSDDRRDDRDDRDDSDDGPGDRPRREFGPREEPSNGLATAGLILGILALLTGPCSGIPAAICSAIALGRPGGRASAIAGLILGGFGTLVLPLAAGLLLLPAMHKVREAAARSQDSNNLRQIIVGAHSYASANGETLPPVGENVSWRVHLLPYMEQDVLYKQFDLKQP